MNTYKISSILFASLLAVACGEAEDLDKGSERSGSNEAAPAKLIKLENPPPPVEDTNAKVATVAQSPSDIEGILAAAAEVEAARPDFYATNINAEPKPTRNGMPRFSGKELEDADMGVIYAMRLASQRDLDPSIRNALAGALGRTAGDFGPMTVALLGAEADPEIRRTLVMSLRRAGDDSAKAGILLGLSDSDAQVRADAAYAAASHADLVELRAPLRAALADASPVTRAASARALGVLKDNEATDTIVALVGDADAETRLQALRALKRIDTSLLAQVDLAALSQDGDERIAREATKLRAK